MIKLAYCNVEDLNLYEVYDTLPHFRQKKVDFYRFDRDKKLSAGAFLLLKRLLCEAGISDAEFKSEKYGKPYISGRENIHFNISHSNKMVACAISDREVGVDVENIDPSIDLMIAKNYFHGKEYESIMNARNKSDEFFRYWVLKESYMKYTGLGFRLNLNDFTINIEDEIKLVGNNRLKFSLFNLSGYKLAVCSAELVGRPLEYSTDLISKRC